MKILLVDIGNSTVDFRMWIKNKNIIQKIIRIETHDKNWKDFLFVKEYFSYEKIFFDKIIFSSVVPEWNEILYNLAEKYNVDILKIKDDLNLDKKNFNIENFNNLGEDFVANYFAAINNYNFKNFIIVSMGTASTLSIIKNEKFEGTIICPGLKISIDSLISSTSLLKNYEFKKSNNDYGKNTIEAINIGTYNAHFLMINSLIKKLNIENVIFTGGNAKYFLDDINDNNYIYDEELIFKGLISFLK